VHFQLGEFGDFIVPTRLHASLVPRMHIQSVPFIHKIQNTTLYPARALFTKWRESKGPVLKCAIMIFP